MKTLFQVAGELGFEAGRQFNDPGAVSALRRKCAELLDRPGNDVPSIQTAIEEGWKSGYKNGKESVIAEAS